MLAINLIRKLSMLMFYQMTKQNKKNSFLPFFNRNLEPDGFLYSNTWFCFNIITDFSLHLLLGHFALLSSCLDTSLRCFYLRLRAFEILALPRFFAIWLSDATLALSYKRTRFFTHCFCAVLHSVFLCHHLTAS